MPTYVYECSKCSDVFEVEQRIVEDALTDCHCGSKGTVKRLIQPVAVMFNGSGFHINDYASSTAPAPTPATPSNEPEPVKAPDPTPAPATVAEKPESKT